MTDGRNDVMNQEYDYFDVNMEHLSNAMLEAKKAFDEYFEKEDLDGAYWALEMDGYVLSSHEFSPLRSIHMNFDIEKDEDDEPKEL